MLARTLSKTGNAHDMAITPTIETESTTGSSIAISPSPSVQASHSSTLSIPASTLEELSGLQGRVADLNTERANLSIEIQRLFMELEDLQRLNGDLQEQNENYEVLLGERMLNGLGSLADSESIGRATAHKLTAGRLGVETASDGGRSRPSSFLGRLDEEPYGNSDYTSGDRDELQETKEHQGSTSLSNGTRGRRSSDSRSEKLSKKETNSRVDNSNFEAELARLGLEKGENERMTKLDEEVKLLRQENKGVN